MKTPAAKHRDNSDLRHRIHATVTFGATVGALGVVFGDIGTSPLYALQAVFSIDHSAVRTNPADVYGVLSLVFWSFTIVVSLKYVLLVLRADNDGEGGVLALAVLVRRALADTAASRVAIVMAAGIFGAALFFGDSVITPAISVLSAVSGVDVAAPALSHAVVPTAAVILTALFSVQRWGTGRIGALFGPVMLAWFLVLALTGVRQVAADPSILRGLSPNYGVEFFAAHPNTAFMAMGAVALTITGAEALFADLGHFGRRPIRRAWFAVVFPSLTLNYLAQGSIILRHPATKANPFFLLVPAWAQIPLVALAAAATVIASQAVISGAFSVSHQAIQLGLLPRLRSHHTSRQNARRVYVGAVNWALFAAVLAVTVGFGSAARLATAYGVTVSGTFLITTTLLLNLARTVWRWRTWQLLAATIGIGAAELTYFAANLTKVTHGGWLPILIALTLFTIMMTWHRAHEGAQSDGWPVTRIPIQL